MLIMKILIIKKNEIFIVINKLFNILCRRYYEKKKIKKKD